MKSRMEKLFVLLLIALLLTDASPAEAQQAKKISRIGFLISASQRAGARRVQAFEQALHLLGYVAGKNIVIEYRFAEGKVNALPALADELVHLKLDVIVTDTSRAIAAAKHATETIPVVFTVANDPVADHQVASLAKPGGNLTGFSILALDLNGKRLELLKEAFPQILRIGFLTRIGTAIGQDRFKEAEAAATALGLQLQFLGAKGAEDLESVLDTAKHAGVQALLAHPSTFVGTHRAQIIQLAEKYRLPAIYAQNEYPEAGGLMSYGPDLVDNYRRAAVYVDKILKGAKPADLPVEQPKKFEFIINLKTAKQIGLRIPPNVLARADRVIR